MTRKRLNRSGSASLEFALVAALYTMMAVLILCLSATLCAQAVAEMTAWDTARCTAIGSADCPDAADFARTMVGRWGGIVFAPSVRVSTAPCNNASGTEVSLAFGSSILAGQLLGTQIAANACFRQVQDDTSAAP